jgi:hypothetical protein
LVPVLPFRHFKVKTIRGANTWSFAVREEIDFSSISAFTDSTDDHVMRDLSVNRWAIGSSVLSVFSCFG